MTYVSLSGRFCILAECPLMMHPTFWGNLIRFKLVGDGKRQFSCHSSVRWFPRDGATISFGSEVGLRAMFEAGWQKSHGWRLFVLANVIEIFVSCCILALDNGPFVCIWCVVTLSVHSYIGGYVLNYVVKYMRDDHVIAISVKYSIA